MRRYDKLNHIANGLHAANKIRQMQKSMHRGNPDTSDNNRKYNILTDSLHTIVDYSPDPHRTTIGDSFNKSRMYSEAYRELKNHFREIKNNSGSPNHRTVLKTLDIVKPVVGDRQRKLIEKILRLFEVLES